MGTRTATRRMIRRRGFDAAGLAVVRECLSLNAGFRPIADVPARCLPTYARTTVKAPE
jgi:hypothetical protein